MNFIHSNNENLADGKLIPLSKEYLKIVYDWRNTYQIRKYMFNDSKIQWNKHLEWFENLQKENKKMHFVFLYKNKPLGFVSFSEFNQSENLFSWGFYISPENEIKGISYLMGMKAINKMFSEFNSEGIYGEVITDNYKSIRYHLQLGFSLVSNKSLIRNNREYDLYYLSKREWDIYNINITKNLIKNFPEIFPE